LRREAQRKESAKRAKELEAESSKTGANGTPGDEDETDGYYDLIKKSKTTRETEAKEQYDMAKLDDR